MTAWLELDGDPAGWLRADQVVCVVEAGAYGCWVYGPDGSKWRVAHPAAMVVGWLAGTFPQTVYPPEAGTAVPGMP